MTKIKTCVYAISLNEIKHVDQFMAACAGADLVLVGDTGSTDGTPERLRELGAVVHTISQKPWRFDIPRNTVLSLIPADIDLCLSVDLDEYLQPGWVDALQQAWSADNTINRVGYDYIWNWKSPGEPDIRFVADKIHHRMGYQWLHPCHETLYYKGEGNERKVTVNSLQLQHHADTTKSRSQYLPLLALAVAEEPNNDRMRHYYARELMFKGMWIAAIEQFDIHLAMPSAAWREERCASLRYMARCYRELHNYTEALKQAQLATVEWPHSREPWLELARSAYHSADWPVCFMACVKCLGIPNQTNSYMNDSACWGYEPYDYGSIAAWHLGLKDKSIELVKRAIELNPADLRLQSNLQLINA